MYIILGIIEETFGYPVHRYYEVLETIISVQQDIKYRLTSIKVMITHYPAAERYITQILINNEYHGECNLNDSVTKCDFLDCTLYQDKILTYNSKMRVNLFYGNKTNVDDRYCYDEHGFYSAFASISLQPVGTGKQFVFTMLTFSIYILFGGAR